MPLPKAPAKRQAPALEDEDEPSLFLGNSPLTETPPQKTPTQKRRKVKTKTAAPIRRSQRALTRVATDNSIGSIAS